MLSLRNVKTAVCTIVAKNYLPFARVLMASVRQFHPDFQRIVLLVDNVDGYFDPEQEDFTLLPSTVVDVPQSKWFHFKYDILELSTGLKPYALEMLLDRYGLDRIIYLDPDIKIYHGLDPVTNALAQSDITLTPHLTEGIDDELRPSELDILQAGSYNLGFIALTNTENVRSFLRWWQKNLQDQCIVDLSRGLFVDQKWIDLVPGLFPSVGILRDYPGLNVAYWNMHGRRIEQRDGAFRVNGKPLYFFHFSGFDPSAPEAFSKHQNRFQTAELGGAAPLIHAYAQELIEQGFTQCRQWPCAYNLFSDGTTIPRMTRRVLQHSPHLQETIDDPFSPAGFKAVAGSWNETILGPDGIGVLTRLAHQVYRLRPDLQVQMPDVFNAHWGRFLSWMTTSGKDEYQLPEVFLEPIRGLLIEADASNGAGPTAPSRHETAADHPLPYENGASAQPTTLSRHIHESRPDLRQAFPDPWRRDSLNFHNWLLSYGRREHQIGDAFCQPFLREWERLLSNEPTPFHAWWYRARLAAYSMSASRKVRLSNSVHDTRVDSSAAAFTEPLQSTAAPAEQSPEPMAADRHRTTRAPVFESDASLGINAVGYVNAEMGVGEVVRTTIRAARAVGIDTAVKRITTGGAYREKDLRFGSDEVLSYPVNVIHINADETPAVLDNLGSALLSDRYNIGYWCWELEEFPDKFSTSFAHLNEIWTLSRFCQDAIARKSPVPVIRIPPAVELAEIPYRSRSHFGLPDDVFLVLTAFDMASIFERKNPIASVQAFVEALGEDQTSHLVIKASNGQKNPEAMQSLREACDGHRITIIDEIMERMDVYALFQVSDCLISLHRSEGFGLMIAEAMYLGKPVVVTGYSGNMDFTTMANSFQVGYRLVSVPPNCDPYPETAHWAEPSIADAVEHLRTLRSNAAQRVKVAQTAKADIRRHFSPEAIGQQILQRLQVLELHAPSSDQVS